MDDDSLNTVGGHCPVCGQEYRPGFVVCADDGAELVPGPAPAPTDDDDAAAPGSSGAARTDGADLSSELGPPAELGSFPVQEAILLAGRLRSIGIPAMAESDSADGPYRNLAGFGGQSRVFVKPEDLERARRATERILEGTGDEA